MRSRGLWIGLVAALMIAVPAVASAPRISIWFHGSWCWFADPRAIHVSRPVDRTFVGWIDWTGAVRVGEFDATTRRRHSRVVGYLYHDDHGSPSIIVEPSGKLTVFFSAHNGGALYYRTSRRPLSIDGWGPTHRVQSNLAGNQGFTYPNPAMLPAEHNRLYLFWRGSDWSQDYATRSASGRWSAAQRLIVEPGQRPYAKVDTNNHDTIALAFTNGHPRERVTSIYFAMIRHGWVEAASGRKIRRLGTHSIRPSDASLVYDGGATGVPSWVWDVSFDRHGRPVIVYATFPSLSNHEYWYAHWTGSRWVSHFITFAGGTISPGTIETEYSGGIALDHARPGIVYLSKQVNGQFEIERWVTGNEGSSWVHHVVVRGDNNVRPVVPRGYDGGPMGLLWLRGLYGSYTSYRTSIAYLL